MPKKKPRKPSNVKVYRQDQWKCASWCHDNGINIYHVPKRYNSDGFYIEVYSYGETTRSIKYDTIDEASYKIWELYCVIYDRYNKDSPNAK